MQVDLERTAYHEAGHAVTGRLSGRCIKSVNIGGKPMKDADAEGVVLYHYEPCSEDPADFVRVLFVEVGSLLGGAIAEWLKFGSIFLPGLRHDFAVIADKEAILRKLWRCVFDSDGEPLAPDAWMRITGLLTSNWPAVVAVAETLLERRWLSGPEIHRMISDAQASSHLRVW